MVDMSVTPALSIMELVAQQDAATLLPIIQQHVRPGTIDLWAAYNNVQRLLSVVQYQTFIESATGVHIQHRESYWNRVKTKIKKLTGCHDQMLSSYLDEFMWCVMAGQLQKLHEACTGILHSGIPCDLLTDSLLVPLQFSIIY